MFCPYNKTAPKLHCQVKYIYIALRFSQSKQLHSINLNMITMFVS